MEQDALSLAARDGKLMPGFCRGLGKVFHLQMPWRKSCLIARLRHTLEHDGAVRVQAALTTADGLQGYPHRLVGLEFHFSHLLVSFIVGTRFTI